MYGRLRRQSAGRAQSPPSGYVKYFTTNLHHDYLDAVLREVAFHAASNEMGSLTGYGKIGGASRCRVRNDRKAVTND